METVTLVTFALVITCTLISCAAAVVSYLNAKKPMSVEIQSNVDELIFLVDRMMKDQRKEKMQRVRASSKDTSDPAGDPNGAPAGLQPARGKMSKAELRAMLRQKAGLQ